MKEQLSSAMGIVIEGTGLLVGVDVGVHQPSLFTIYVYISLVNADLVVAYGFNFGALQNNASLVSVKDLEVKIGLFVLGDRLPAHATHFNTERFPIQFLLDDDSGAKSMT